MGNRNDKLKKAVEEGEGSAVRSLLEGGVDPNAYRCANTNGYLPLHVCIERGDVGLTSLLLSHGASVHLPTTYAPRAIHLACKVGNEEILSLLLKTEMVDVNEKDSWDQTPLYYAVKGKNSLIWMLLSADAQPDCLDSSGTTVFHLAAQQRNMELMMKLLGYSDKGPSILCSSTMVASSSRGDSTVKISPLAILLEQQCMNEAMILIDLIKEQGCPLQDTSMAWGVVMGGADESLIHMSLQELDVQQVTQAVSTLMAAFMRKEKKPSESVLRLIREHNGAKGLENALQSALSRGKVELATILVQCGVDVSDPQLLFKAASARGASDMIGMLIEYGCDVHSTVAMDAMHRCSSYGHDAAADLIKEARAQPKRERPTRVVSAPVERHVPEPEVEPEPEEQVESEPEVELVDEPVTVQMQIADKEISAFFQQLPDLMLASEKTDLLNAMLTKENMERTMTADQAVRLLKAVEYEKEEWIKLLAPRLEDPKSGQVLLDLLDFDFQKEEVRAALGW